MLSAQARHLRRQTPGAWQQLGAGWLHDTAGSSNPAPWVLHQRDGGGSTTASSGGGGAATVRLLYRYDQPSSAGLPPDAAAAAAAADPPTATALGRLRQVAVSQLQATFLPSGYPHTVAPGYLRNTLWQGLHHAAGSANGVLASTFLLYSVGLGAGAVPTAGALNWVLKDGLGQAGTLLFGKAIAHNFDVSSRAWYLLASAKLNLAMGLEICTLLLPHYFLPIGALANAIKGLSWMAGGSTKSVFKVAFAADNNFGDVSAKATSQTICASLVGTSAGVALASQLGQAAGAALGCYAGLAAVHMWAGYRAVRCVPLATLNPTRLELLIRRYLQCVSEQQGQQQQAGRQQAGQQPPPKQQDAADARGGGAPHPAAAAAAVHTAAAVCLPTPIELAPHDPVFKAPWLHIGTPLRTLAARSGAQLASAVQQQQAAQQQAAQQAQPAPLHLLVPGGGGGGGLHLLLHEKAEAADCILGFLHSYLLHHSSSSSSSSTGSPGSPANGPQQQREQERRLASTLAEARRLLPGLLAALEAAGWDDQKVVLEPKRRRLTW